VNDHFIHIIDRYPTMPPMTRLPTSFARWLRWFLGWFLYTIKPSFFHPSEHILSGYRSGCEYP
jgi:hypothetical protein